MAAYACGYCEDDKLGEPNRGCILSYIYIVLLQYICGTPYPTILVVVPYPMLQQYGADLWL